MQVILGLGSDVHGPRGLIVDDVTESDIAAWRDAAANDPDRLLEFPRARVHLIADPRPASVRASRITEIRPLG